MYATLNSLHMYATLNSLHMYATLNSLHMYATLNCLRITIVWHPKQFTHKTNNRTHSWDHQSDFFITFVSRKPNGVQYRFWTRFVLKDLAFSKCVLPNREIRLK